MHVNGPTALAGLLVGMVVGLTGVGGGALMTPILVLLFGIAPQTAVGTDLAFASITKVFGTAVHGRARTIDWQVVRRLSLGSLPASALTLVWMNLTATTRVKDGFLMEAVAVALLVTAVGMVLKERLHRLGRRFRLGDPGRFKHLQPVLTVLAGAILGVLVTLTSIGAGALGTVMLVYLYPLRLDPARLVGTDLAHAIPLALLAGFGHFRLGHVETGLLVNLLLGSIPGVVLGALASSRAPTGLIRNALAILLAGVGLRMLIH